MTKYQFLHDNENEDAKAIALPPVFSKNSQAKLNFKVESLSPFSSIHI